MMECCHGAHDIVWKDFKQPSLQYTHLQLRVWWKLIGRTNPTSSSMKSQQGPYDILGYHSSRDFGGLFFRLFKKINSRGRENRDRTPCRFTACLLVTSWTGPGQSWELGISTRIPTWVSGTQLSESSSFASQAVHWQEAAFGTQSHGSSPAS